MSWGVPGKYDLDYIYDNQGKKYDESAYHVRNINYAK